MIGHSTNYCFGVDQSRVYSLLSFVVPSWRSCMGRLDLYLSVMIVQVLQNDELVVGNSFGWDRLKNNENWVMP